MVIDSVSSGSLAPARSTSAALIESEIGVDSMTPAADTGRPWASACSSSLTINKPVVEARLRASLEVAVTDRLKLFFFNDAAATEIYALSLHDALPISL